MAYIVHSLLFALSDEIAQETGISTSNESAVAMRGLNRPESINTTRVSVVVPVFNEAQQVESLIAQLQWLQNQNAEILVADGGSTDGTVEQLRASGFTVLIGEQGRAMQMHKGATAATGEILLFLHADTRLPSQALQLISAGVGGDENSRSGKNLDKSLGKSSTKGHLKEWGRFDVAIEGRPWMFKVVAWMMNARSRYTGIATGDQAIFVTRSAYERVGGFPQQPLMEDVELSKRLKQLSPPLCLRPKVRTSGRRWERHGVWRTIYLMWKLRWQYWRGVKPERLAELWLRSN